MSFVEKRTVSLQPEQAQYIDTLVSSGGYASASEVVRAGLRALQERDAAIDRWLRDEVIPVYDAIEADPSSGFSAEEVADHLLALHLERSRKTPPAK
jgi:antitoxin ParD1/3/4